MSCGLNLARYQGRESAEVTTGYPSRPTCGREQAAHFAHGLSLSERQEKLEHNPANLHLTIPMASVLVSASLAPGDKSTFRLRRSPRIHVSIIGG